MFAAASKANAKEVVLQTARVVGMFALARRATQRHLRILAYHGLWTTPGYQYGDRLFIKPEQFEQRMQWLKRSHYPVLPLEEAVRRLTDDSLPSHAVVITIDDGWSSTFTHMLPILEALDLPATLFVTTWYCEHQLPVVNVAVDYLLKRAGVLPSSGPALVSEIDGLPTLEQRTRSLRSLAEKLDVTIDDWWEARQFHLMTANEVAEARRRGMDIQLHTHRHLEVDKHVDQLHGEIFTNREVLARFTGEKDIAFNQFCYPSGGYDPRADTILRKAGVRSAVLVDQGINAPHSPPYRLRRFLDGRSISQVEFEAYLSGALEYLDRAKNHLRRAR